MHNHQHHQPILPRRRSSDFNSLRLVIEHPAGSIYLQNECPGSLNIWRATGLFSMHITADNGREPQGAPTELVALLGKDLELESIRVEINSFHARCEDRGDHPRASAASV